MDSIAVLTHCVRMTLVSLPENKIVRSKLFRTSSMASKGRTLPMGTWFFTLLRLLYSQTKFVGQAAYIYLALLANATKQSAISA